MTSSGPVIKGPCCLLTHKDYAVGEVGSFVQPTDIGPCDLLGTEDLEASALFDLTRDAHSPKLSWFCFFLVHLTDACVFFRPWFASRPFRIVALQRKGSLAVLGNTMPL